MSTGEKISKFRKQYNYTQEELACILGVSRQSISKWESDTSFPETEKLIQLSKLFHCSIDYLLKDESEIEHCEEELQEEKVEKNVVVQEEAPKVKKENSFGQQILRNLPLKIILLVYSFAMFGVFAAPFASGKVYVFGSTASVSCSFYNIIFAAGYEYGNYMLVILFICNILVVCLSLLFLFINTKGVYRSIVITLFVIIADIVISWMSLMQALTAGFYIYSIITIALFIVMFAVKELRYDKRNEEKTVSDNIFSKIHHFQKTNLATNILFEMFIVLFTCILFCYWSAELTSTRYWDGSSMTQYTNNQFFDEITYNPQNVVIFIAYLLIILFFNVHFFAKKKFAIRICRISVVVILLCLIMTFVGAIIQSSSNSTPTYYLVEGPYLAIILVLVTTIMQFIPLFRGYRVKKEENITVETDAITI